MAIPNHMGPPIGHLTTWQLLPPEQVSEEVREGEQAEAIVFCPILFVRNESVGPVLTQEKKLGVRIGGAFSEATDHSIHRLSWVWLYLDSGAYDSLGLGHSSSLLLHLAQPTFSDPGGRS